MAVSNRRMVMCVSAAWAMVASAGLALGQAGGGGGDFDRPLGGAASASAGAEGTSRVEMFFSQRTGDNQVELSIRDGEMSARVNGREVPADRIRRSNGKVEVLDEGGGVLATFNVSVVRPPSPPAAGRVMRGVPPVPPVPPRVPGVEEQPKPPVMMGITMGEPSDSVREHLGLEAGQSVLVERVVAGLPAAKAGLRERDIIVSFDGKRPVDGDAIRQILRGKKAGDKVEVVVIRRGQEQALTLELEGYDPEKLGALGEGMALRNLPRAQVLGPGFDQEFFERQMKEAMRGVEGLRNPEVMGRLWMLGPDGQLQGLVPGQEERLQEMQRRIEDRMKQLEERLAKMNEQMARLQELMERRAREGGR